MKARDTKVGVAVLALALLLATAVPAMAADSVTVNAEVDVNPYSIVLEEGETLDYGMRDVGDWGPPQFWEMIVVRNNGGSNARLDIIGTDAVNGTGGAWDLGAMTGEDQFRWYLSGPFGHADVDDDASSSLVSEIPPGDAAWFDPVVYMPTSTTQYGTYTWSGTIYASAP